MTQVKATFDGDLRRFELAKPGYDLLVTALRNAFGLTQLVVKYMDDEDDLVTLANEEDFRTACDVSAGRCLRVFVFDAFAHDVHILSSEDLDDDDDEEDLDDEDDEDDDDDVEDGGFTRIDETHPFFEAASQHNPQLVDPAASASASASAAVLPETGEEAEEKVSVPFKLRNGASAMLPVNKRVLGLLDLDALSPAELQERLGKWKLAHLVESGLVSAEDALCVSAQHGAKPPRICRGVRRLHHRHDPHHLHHCGHGGRGRGGGRHCRASCSGPPFPHPRFPTAFGRGRGGRGRGGHHPHHFPHHPHHPHHHPHGPHHDPHHPHGPHHAPPHPLGPHHAPHHPHGPHHDPHHHGANFGHHHPHAHHPYFGNFEETHLVASQMSGLGLGESALPAVRKGGCRFHRPKAARFVRSVTLDDGTSVRPLAEVTKTWRVRNDTSEPWPKNCEVVAFGGDVRAFGSSHGDAVEIPGGLAPGEERDVSVTMTMASRPGFHCAFWKLRELGGKPFGQRLFVRLIVRDDAASADDAAGSTPAAPVHN